MITLFVDEEKVDVEFHSFPGGERNVRISHSLRKNAEEEVYREYMVIAHITSSDEIMDLLLLKDALDGHTNISLQNCISNLYLTYLPYARQDRMMQVGEAVGVRVMANLINSMNFNHVLLNDVHSDVGSVLIKKAIEVKQEEIVTNYFDMAGIDLKSYTLCSPDAGAMKKVMALSMSLGGLDIVVGHKHRDPRTGIITGTSVSGSVAGKKVLIVDDICDGGATFTNLATVLRADGATQVDLFVTHGIFSKGIDDVFDGVIDNIYSLYAWKKYVEGKNEKGILKNVSSEDLF